MVYQQIYPILSNIKLPGRYETITCRILKVNAIKFSCTNQRMFKVYQLQDKYNCQHWFKIFDFALGTHVGQDKGNGIC